MNEEAEIEDECERVINRLVSAQAVRRMRRAKARAIPHTTRLAIFAADNNRCWLCGNALEFNVNPSHPYAASIDHVVPLSKGGTNSLSNLRAAHRRCNTIRGNGDQHKRGPKAPTKREDYATFNEYLERLVRQGDKRIINVRQATGLMRVSVKQYLGEDSEVLFRYQGKALKGAKVTVLSKREI